MKISVNALLLLILILLSGNLFAAEFNAIQIHGFISQGYIQSNENNFFGYSKDGSFEMNEMALNFGTMHTPKLRFGMQLLAKDLGSTGNDELTMDYAFADYRFRNWLGFRAGKVKMDYGLYGKYWDIDSVRTYIFLPRAFTQPASEISSLLQKVWAFMAMYPVTGGGIYHILCFTEQMN